MGLFDAIQRGALRLPPSLLLRLAGGRPTVTAGRVLEPALQLAAARSAGTPHMATLTPARARLAADAGFRVTSPPPSPGVSIQPLALPGPAGSLPARAYRPSGLATPAPLLLYFHQGGFVIGNLDWCEAFCALLAERARCLVVSVDYRLAPEHLFPAAHDDAWAAWQWAAREAAGLGGDPERLAVGGDSAGGNLAAFLCHEALRAGGPRPVFQLLIYPWVTNREPTPSLRDFADAWPLDQRLIEWFRGHVFETPDQRDDGRVNPLHEERFDALPPAHVAVAGFDPLCDEGLLYARKLAAAGVPVTQRCHESLCHSFTGFGAVPAALRAQQEAADALARGLGTA